LSAIAANANAASALARALEIDITIDITTSSTAAFALLDGGIWQCSSGAIVCSAQGWRFLAATTTQMEFVVVAVVV